MKFISKIKQFNSFVFDDINSLITYYTFISNLLEKFKKNFDSYFENFLTKIGKYEDYFTTAWIIFAYVKKSVLMRKNDYVECCSTIICIMKIFNEVFTLWIKKFSFNYNEAFLGSN